MFNLLIELQSTLVISISIIWITAYLEEKILSLFKHRKLATGNKILWISIAPQEQFLPFPTIFSIYISN